MTPSRTETIAIRTVDYHVHHWGREDAPMLFLLHGWMDVGASFQFLADELAARWHLIAPDWRGFGLSNWPARDGAADCYWFGDYLADLDALLDHYAPDGEVNLVGHSMGANVVCLYAGVRPSRVRRVVDLEGFGLPATRPEQAAGQFARWLDALKQPPQLRPYASLDAVAERLRRNNPRLSAERAAFLATHWARRRADGQWEILGDPAHKLPGALLYRLDEVMAVWRQVQAPVLHVEGRDTDVLPRFARGEPDAFRERFAAFPDFRTAIVDDAGHMLHHDQPERVAQLIDAFCRS